MFLQKLFWAFGCLLCSRLLVNFIERVLNSLANVEKEAQGEWEDWRQVSCRE